MNAYVFAHNQIIDTPAPIGAAWLVVRYGINLVMPLAGKVELLGWIEDEPSCQYASLTWQ